ncbi:hypothetical protein SAMN04488003_10345 [Loktanella fryxellensis]|uniref:Uncharacterized protein n=1 Tax=Loktanella fryxellensis TaxID=245187 RepID=A0A1H8A9K3_9RHOB|nr:hypothetical protein [Loktanella fryxellensis]SEM66479.1 hypothetical protein SAMN04488003_10345 [Loktanella fryxellensis]
MTQVSRKSNEAPTIHQSFAPADVAPRVAPLDLPRQVLEQQEEAGALQGMIDMVARLWPRSA